VFLIFLMYVLSVDFVFLVMDDHKFLKQFLSVCFICKLPPWLECFISRGCRDKLGVPVDLLGVVPVTV
jgi:hypothetical protein